MTYTEENEMAKSYGFTPVADAGRGGPWCKFVRDNENIWMCRSGWQTAKLIDNRYCEHKPFKNLKDAFERFTSER